MHRSFAVLLAAAGLSFAGCGESVDFPDTAPVTGTVTLDGKPVEGAEILLRPDNVEQKAYPARATSGADGTFDVKTFFSAAHDVEGAVPGKYQVVVTKQQATGAVSSHAEGLSASSGRPANPRTGRGGQHGDMTAVKNVLPEKYADWATSGLTIDVKDDDNEVKLELTSK